MFSRKYQCKGHRLQPMAFCALGNLGNALALNGLMRLMHRRIIRLEKARPILRKQYRPLYNA